MHPLIQKILSSLENIQRHQSIQKHYQVIDLLASGGKVEMLYDLAVALEENQWELSDLWAVDSLFDYLERVLALNAGQIYAETLVKVLALPRTKRLRNPDFATERVCYLAALLASKQDMIVLQALVQKEQENPAIQEFLCALIQEMILRGLPCAEDLLIVAFIEKMRELAHPLAMLPLELTNLEANLPLATYGLRYTNSPLPSSQVPEGLSPTLYPHALRDVHVTDISSQAVIDKMRAAVWDWSHGTWEARAVQLDQTISTDHLSGRLLRQLGVSCVQNTEGDKIFLSIITGEDALRILFAAASAGGSYDQGHYGAYGRLDAWNSLGGLVGAHEQASVIEIAKLVRESLWCYFRADNEWFYQQPWDIGLLAIRPDRSSLGIIAATATY
ncbi:hypothetical protein KTT_46030 [Tengunoibacter tsumagoiensis]|uniref:Uncharacterized protein n=2 Tax=Tengunoibacter tsumagoiensis TaxID=2014871 RepID=A0A402A6H9_9CHLR|nr:hypothetical protein KTT_46030 [Tengunoibacter tsumagoiensis]